MAGDEFGNSQDGNNNAYCQDNAVSWLNWKLLETHKDQVDFVNASLPSGKPTRCSIWTGNRGSWIISPVDDRMCPITGKRLEAGV